MGVFAKWLAAQRVRRVVLIAGLFPLPFLGLISAAVVVMTAQVKGPREALLDCLLALVLLAGMTFVTGMNVSLLVGGALLSWSVWLALGTIVARSGSLALAAQAAVLMALVGLLLFNTAVGDPVLYWSEVLQELYAELDVPEIDPAALEAQAGLMSGVVLAGSLTGAMLALLLGSSLASRLTAGDFARQFAGLKLGYVIGGLAAIAGVASLIGLGPDGVLLIFGAGFMFHGLAVLVWWARSRGWPGGWWIGLCILPVLLPDFLIVETIVLAALGFVDNWYDLRRVTSGAA